MNKSALQMIFMGVLTAFYLMACERRPLEDITYSTAPIPVKIDWSKSGISVTKPTGEEYVHRVSLRFYPKDGSEVFDRYLEGNITEGNIEVPVGKYSVVVFNESIYDPYWSKSVFFTDVNDYSKFAAHVINDDVTLYPFYDSIPGETVVVEPLRLASWSLDNFEVTADVVVDECGTPVSKKVPTDLTKIVMRKLTYNVNVLAEVQNLRSAQFIQGAIRGFSNKVYMASGLNAQTPTTHIFTFNGRKWNTGSQTDGTTEKDFLSFGLLPSPGQYILPVNVLFVTGELYKPTEPLLYDVSSQTNSNVNSDIKIRIKFVLPYKEGGIDVGDWDDEDHIIN